MRESDIRVQWFEGTRYWEVVNGANNKHEQLFTTQDRYEAFKFAAELILTLRAKGIIND